MVRGVTSEYPKVCAISTISRSGSDIACTKISTVKGGRKREFGDLLLKAVKFGLESCVDPFRRETKLFVKKEGIALTAKEALEYLRQVQV